MVGTLRFARPTAATPAQKRQRISVIKTDLSDLYRNYIACLNKQDWAMLNQFVQSRRDPQWPADRLVRLSRNARARL
jgi:hypothetical protein